MNTIEKKIGKATREVAYVLRGAVKNGIWHARLVWKSRGDEASVMFDGERVLRREEEHGDIIGFYHTHPQGLTSPSARDDKTMTAWSFCFGKPLLCIIGTEAGLRGWIYDWRVDRVEVTAIELFENEKWLVALTEKINGP